ncbi:hypothetical protein [Kitasatospora sp. NBC_00458]|uniref:hypothetical protein n=1 Tax=Kitasatospora sp. NBC_00458 TaxID=2903568 RepID=UPI002E187CF9
MRTTRSAFAVGAVSALAAGLLGGCTTAERDPRAYPGSPGGQKLENVLEAFALRLPDCQVDELGFAGSAKRGEERLGLSFRAPKDCVQGFLAAHGTNTSRPLHWTPGREKENNDAGLPPVLKSRSDKLGWKFDPAVTYELYVSATTPSGSRFTVVVDPNGPTERVFMDSVELGRKRG